MHLKTVDLSEYYIDVIIILLLSSMDPCTYEALIVTNHKIIMYFILINCTVSRISAYYGL